MRGRKKYLNQDDVRNKSFTIKINQNEKELLEKNPQIKKELIQLIRKIMNDYIEPFQNKKI